MQLPDGEELVLVSGLPHIQARKLRYYEDRNFLERIDPAPRLSENGYQDRPAPRPDDWSGQVRGIHADLSRPLDKEFGSSGGEDLQRQPELWEKAAGLSPDHVVESTLTDDDDPAADTQAMGSVRRAHAMNNGE